jgi:hypothetical protein
MNFPIKPNAGRVALGRDLDVYTGKAAGDACNATRNLDTD